jgi:hypothetical protein
MLLTERNRQFGYLRRSGGCSPTAVGSRAKQEVAFGLLQRLSGDDARYRGRAFGNGLL